MLWLRGQHTCSVGVGSEGNCHCYWSGSAVTTVRVRYRLTTLKFHPWPISRQQHSMPWFGNGPCARVLPMAQGRMCSLACSMGSVLSRVGRPAILQVLLYVEHGSQSHKLHMLLEEQAVLVRLFAISISISCCFNCSRRPMSRHRFYSRLLP